MIGTYGPVVFTASDELLRTFSGMQRSRTARFARHNVVGGKPKIEFTGDDLDSLTFEMRFDARMGVDPVGEIQKLADIKSAGGIHTMIVGGEIFGDFVITDLSEDRRHHDGRGQLVVGSVSVTMLESVEDALVF